MHYVAAVRGDFIMEESHYASVPLAIVVVAQEVIVAEGIVGLVRQNPGMVVCGVCTTKDSVWPTVLSQSPDVVVFIDLWFDVIEDLRAKLHSGRVREPRWCFAVPVMTPFQIAHATRIGVDRVGMKELLRQSDGASTYRIDTGQFAVAADRVSTQIRAIAADHVDEEILHMLITGASNDHIAKSVYLSIQTVKNRVSRMLKVAGVANRTELAVQLTCGESTTTKRAS